MCVIPVGAVLTNLEAISKRLFRFDPLKTVKSGDAIHQPGQEQAMPVQRGILIVQIVLYINDRVITFFKFQQRCRECSVYSDWLDCQSAETERAFINDQLVFFYGCKQGRRRDEAEAQTQALTDFKQHNLILNE